MTTDRSYKWIHYFTISYVSFVLYACLQFMVDPFMSEERILLLDYWYPFDPLVYTE